MDGEFVYGGALNGDFVTTTVVPASAYPNFNTLVMKKVDLEKEQESDKSIVIKCGAWNSFPESVMESISNSKRDVELIYKAADGQMYRILIPARTDVKQYVDENGYCGLAYLGLQLGQVPYTE